MIGLMGINTAIERWGDVAPLLQPVRSEADYKARVCALDRVLDAGGADENHPLAQLADYIGEQVAEWEARDKMPAAASGVEMLRHLMAEHSLRQGDIPEIGSQGVVSEVLGGTRDLNLRQVRALAARFKVPVQWFL